MYIIKILTYFDSIYHFFIHLPPQEFFKFRLPPIYSGGNFCLDKALHI